MAPSNLIVWISVTLRRLTVSQLAMKFPAFHKTGNFVNVFTRFRHLSLYWASWIQNKFSHPLPIKPTLVLSTHLRRGLSAGTLPCRFSHQNPVSTSLLTHACHMPYPSRPRHYNPDVAKLLTLRFSPVSWYLLSLRPTYLPRTLPYSIHTRCSCLDVGYQVRHPHQTRGKIGCCDQSLCVTLYTVLEGGETQQPQM